MSAGPGLKLVYREWTFRPADSAKLLPVDFELPPGLGALEIRFKFVPPGCTDRTANAKAITDAVRAYVSGTPFQEGFDVGRYMADRNLSGLLDRVDNLLNLTLHDPEGRQVGRWDTVDRDNPPAAFVSARAASPGFAPAPLTPGRWRIVVEVWHVFHTACKATLEVLGHTRSTAPLPCTVSFPPVRGASSARGGGISPAMPSSRAVRRPVPGISRVRLAGLYYGEMHAHTTHSDGTYTVHELAEKAQGLGLDFVAVTDHNATSAHAEATADLPVTLIRGEELTTFHGHFCLYGVDRCYPWHDDSGRLTVRSALSEALGRGALTSLAHPFAIPPPICVGCPFRPGRVPYRSFRLMEIWSGAWRLRYPEIHKALRLWDRLNDRGIPLVGIAARDWHGSAQEDTPTTRFPVTAVFAEGPGEQALLDAIAAGRVLATSGPVVCFSAEGTGGCAGLGQRLCSQAGRKVRFSAGIHLPGKMTGQVRLLRNGRVVATAPLEGQCESTVSFEWAGTGRYRIEVWSDNGELLAVTNHVQVTNHDPGDRQPS